MHHHAHQRSITTTILGRNALLGIAALALLASCGDGGRLTEAEFLKKGNAVYSESNARIEEAAAATFADGPPADAAAAQPFLDVVVTEIDGQVDAIGELVPPDELEDRVDAMLAEVTTATAAMQDQMAADPMAFLDAGPTSFADADAMATEIGLTECAG
jgi:nitroreductase